MRRFLWLVAPVGAISLALALAAVSEAQSRTPRPKVEEAEVELFDALRSGEIEVRVIAKDSTAGNVLIKNTTARRLTIKLPEVFAAVPVAAQFFPAAGAIGGPGGGFNPAFNGAGAGLNGFGGATQALGGGFQPGGGNVFGGPGGNFGRGPGMGLGPGLFKVEPEKAGKLKMTAVCLEHGKRDPNSRIEYELRPIEDVTDNAGTIEAIKLLVRGEIDQRTAQAVAWHLENGLSWEKLAGKIGSRHLTGRIEMFFSGDQLKRARRIVEEAQQSSEKRDSLAQSQ